MSANRPFRAEHAGSLLRPEALFQKRRDINAGKGSENLKSIEDEAIKHVVQLQRDEGMKSITDGELRRVFFFDGLFETLEGMTFIPNRPIKTFKSYMPHINMMYAAGIKEAPTIYCNGKIKRNKPFYTEQFKYLKSIVSPEEVKNIKITMPAPSWFHQRHGSDYTYDLSVYKNDDEYFDAIGAVYREEIKDLYELGCRKITIDDSTLTFFCNDSVVEGMKKANVDPDALLATYIRATNACMIDRPADLTIGVHCCRGNFTGGVHFTEGPYDPIAKTLFNTLNADAFYLEYDDERSGNFAPLTHFPKDKYVVLGIVTTKKPELESMDSLVARVNEAAEAMSNGNPDRSKADALKQICISTQCGFASVWEGNPLTEDDERKKLRLLVETAQKLWPDEQ